MGICISLLVSKEKPQEIAQDKEDKRNSKGSCRNKSYDIIRQETRKLSNQQVNPKLQSYNRFGRVCKIYDFQKPLGVGQYSMVYQVQQIANGRKFACKVMQLPELNQTEEMAEQGENQRLDILREVQILCTMKSRHIVKLIEYYEEDNFLYIMMEYMAGGQLQNFLQECSNYSEADVRTCASQILQGIYYLHESGICHRDLKLDNIMLGKLNDINSVKIVDFGFAKDSKDSFKTIAGAPWYVAPEILNEQAYDFKVDLWNFGCILYLMISGNTPFEDDKDFLIYKKIMKAQFQFEGEAWSQVSKEVKDLIQNLLVVDPKKRFSANEVLQHAWFNLDKNKLQRTQLSTAQQNMKLNRHKQKRQVNVLRARLFQSQINLLQNQQQNTQVTKSQNYVSQYVKKNEFSQSTSNDSQQSNNKAKSRQSEDSVSNEQKKNDINGFSTAQSKSLDINKGSNNKQRSNNTSSKNVYLTNSQSTGIINQPKQLLVRKDQADSNVPQLMAKDYSQGTKGNSQIVKTKGSIFKEPIPLQEDDMQPNSEQTNDNLAKVRVQSPFSFEPNLKSYGTKGSLQKELKTFKNNSTNYYVQPYQRPLLLDQVLS